MHKRTYVAIAFIEQNCPLNETANSFLKKKNYITVWPKPKMWLEGLLLDCIPWKTIKYIIWGITRSLIFPCHSSSCLMCQPFKEKEKTPKNQPIEQSVSIKYNQVHQVCTTKLKWRLLAISSSIDICLWHVHGANSVAGKIRFICINS